MEGILETMQLLSKLTPPGLGYGKTDGKKGDER
jgi:hypothetical protein